MLIVFFFQRFHRLPVVVLVNLRLSPTSCSQQLSSQVLQALLVLVDVPLRILPGMEPDDRG